MDKVMELAKTIRASSEDRNKTSPYDTMAEVLSVDGKTAYVHIPGGVERTPARLVVDAKKGDSVRVRVAGGKAYVTGNATAPPTDDTKANKADAKATAAQNKANEAISGASSARSRADNAYDIADSASGLASDASKKADSAYKIADSTNQYFWFRGEGDDTGAHITEVPQDEWNDENSENYHGGGNLLARSNGIAVRDGLLELATFSASGIALRNSDGNERARFNTDWLALGDQNGARITLNSSTSPYIYMNDGTAQIFRADSNGVAVGNPSGGHSRVKADGLHVWTGAESTASNEVAVFGSTARIGTSADMHFKVSSTQLVAEKGNVPILYINPYGSITDGSAVHIESYTSKTRTALQFGNTESMKDSIAWLGIQDSVTNGRTAELNMYLNANYVQTILASTHSSSSSSYVDLVGGSGAHATIHTAGQILLQATNGVSANSSITTTGYVNLNLNQRVVFNNGRSTTPSHIHAEYVNNTDNLYYVADGYHAFYAGDTSNDPRYVMYVNYDGVSVYRSLTVNNARLTVTGNYIQNQYAYDNPLTYQTNCYINSDGLFRRTTNTSSRRYKHDIKNVVNKELDPHHLYDIEVKQFKYNEDVITDKGDCRYGKDLIGFISEQVKEHYPIAVDINEKGECEAWHQQYIIPPMLALIQEQHKEIESLKAEVKEMKGRVS